MEAAAIEIGVAVAGEAATSLLATVKKHVGYLHHYKDNLNALQEADGQLVAKMSDESKFSGETSRNVRDVSATVVNWRSDAEGLHQKAEKLTPRNNITRLKPWSRYSTSKHASELTPKIKEKAESAPDFGTSFDRPIAEGAKFNLEGYMEFDSRLRIQNEVLDALRNDDVSMCSICGMGGMGKTMMAKKLVKIVENDGLFCKVAMVTVTQTPNLEEIQKCIIESLQLKIYESTIQGKAKRLNDWLSNNKTLLVLDDVWWRFDQDFEKVGIPLGSKVCKIFVTSRNLDVCENMGSKPKIPLKDLEKTEAWELFVQNSGKYNEDMARKIVNECKGLPIAIVTIAGALNGKPRGVWDDSLKKLQKSNLPGISDMDKVHSKIKVSYDLLNDPEAQSCLRLCCLFPEDFDLPVEKLVFYGWGLGIFEGVDRLKEARDRVDTIVHKLKSLFLLLDGEGKRCVKLHDIVRDFAIWISSKDENPYLVSCENEMGKWPEIFQCEKSSAISFVGQIIKNHPVGLRCPNLKLLQLHLESGSDMLPTGFFDGMEELRVVDLIVPSKLPPLTAQKALKTLFINYYSPQMVPLGEGYVKNIEILSLSFWKSVSKILAEIGMMRNLRCLRLHFDESRTLAFIPPGVLSKLVQLEELELPPSFNDWGIEIEGETNASLDEIAFLPLTSITIGLQKGSILPENIVNNITKFQIFLETIPFFNYFSFDSNILFLSEVYECDALLKWTSNLLMKCHHLDLDNVDLKYIMSQQLGGNECYKTKCFSQLDTLMIRRMDGLEQIFNGSYFSNRQQPCFTNLTTITINSCPKLKRAFPLSMAQELTQLATMELSNCGEMEEVFYDDQRGSGNQGEPSIKLNATSKGKQHKHIHQNMEERIEKAGEREVVVLPRLIRLHIDRMPLLRVVYNGNHAIECPSLENLQIKICNDIKGLSYQWGILKLDNMKGHFKNISKWLPLAQKIGIQQIKRLKIERCHEMEYLIDAIEGPTFLKSFFSYLEELSVEHMHSLEEIFGPYVPKIHAQCFTNLTRIWIYKCPKMKHLFPLSMATELRKLKSMRILSCEETEEIFYKDQVEDGNQVASSVRLNNMTIEKSSICCPTPTSFIQCLLPKGKQQKHLPSHQSTEENIQKVDEIEVDPPIVFPQLEELDISYMPKLRVMYNQNHAIECPSLEVLDISDCYNMEGFSYGSFNAPKIKKLKLDEMKNIPKWLHFEQNSGILLEELCIASCNEMTYLVDAVTDRNLLKTLFCNLKNLWIRTMDILEEIWHGPYLSIVQAQPYFSHLTEISISDCPKLKHMFPLSVVTELTQLHKLEIEECGEMEEIFYNDQADNGNQKTSSVESNSQTTGTELALPYSSIPTRQIMEENITKPDQNEVDCADAVVIFPQLKVVILSELSKLQIFYNGNHAAELPSLELLNILQCEEIKALSNGSLKAPKLKEIEINWKRYPSAGEDLNTIVRETLNIVKEEEEDKDGDENEEPASDMDEDE